ncbi:GhoT/OrtT family toxin, partial [Escherichia coli]|nr:GhoT/OrtT family toxin [Escherichia coli]
MALFSKILIFYVIGVNISFVIIWFISHEKTHIRLLSAFLGSDSNLLIVFYVQIMPD